MSQKLPYEKLIAEKMQELPVPDAEASWQKMKHLLDDDMPLEGGAAKKRPGGGWWWKGGLIALISAGTGALIYSNARDDAEEEVIADAKLTEQTIDISVSEKQKSSNTIDQKFTPSTTEKNKQDVTVAPDKNTVRYTDFVNKPVFKKTSTSAKQEAPKGNNRDDGSATASLTQAEPEQTIAFSPVISPDEKARPLKNLTGLGNERDKTAYSSAHGNHFKTGGTESKDPDSNTPATNSEEAGRQQIRSDITGANATDSNDTFAGAGVNHTIHKPYPLPAITGAVTTTEALFVMATVPNENISYSNQKLSIEGDSITVPDNVWQLPDVTAQKKAILKEMKRQERKQERELAKSYRSNQSFWGEQPERWFAAGIAPYQNFSIGSQQTYNYNAAGSKNIATDYIPAPYLQLHVTNRIYILSEFQFNAPQSTPSLLLSQKQLTVPMNTTGYTENTYLRKLYYFNMPVSFYYSPVKNFYLGSGLQFSSFNSGLAYTEQRSANNSIIHSENIKIKDDSLSSKITSSEWRYLFDANYYVKRFMFGFRYNQALNNFVNLSINNTLPPVQARNQSFQFYIRYNIIVSDKRR